MIKNNNGSIEINGSPRNVLIELMQLTHQVALVFSEEVGKEVTLEEMLNRGLELMKEEVPSPSSEDKK